MKFLFLTADTPIGRFDPSMLSPQESMELLVEGFNPEIRRLFQRDDGEYRSFKEWPHVACNRDGDIVLISWNRLSSFDTRKMTGTFAVEYIPDSVHTMIFGWMSFDGGLDFTRLPKCSRTFEVQRTRFSGTIDLTSLPDPLVTLVAVNSQFTGTVDLTQLPPNLRFLKLSENKLSGSVDLSQLNTVLQEISLDRNAFEGDVSLDNLPKTMQRVNIRKNKFCGELTVQYLPPGMKHVMISENNFHGTVNLLECPPGFKLMLQKNEMPDLKVIR